MGRLIQPYRFAVAGGGAPTLTDYQQSTWSDNISTEVTASITWSTGSVIVVMAMTADNASTLATPTAVGLTFAQILAPTNDANSCKGYAWVATAAGAGSGAITSVTDLGTAGRGMSAFVFSGSNGIGASSADAALGATTTKSLTRSFANSFVVQAWGDWNAVNDVAVTWTPTGQTERVAQFVSTQGTFFVANWGDQGAAGATSYGFSGFAGGDMTAVTVEVRGT